MKKFLIFLCLLGSAQIFAQSSFMSAVDSKNYASVQALISTGADVNQVMEVNGQKMTALSLAASKGDVEMVTLLIKKGALVSPVVNGMDALMFAAQGGNREIVDLLLTKGAMVSNESKEGKTAYDYARFAGHSEIASRLLSEMEIIRNQALAKRHKK